MSPVDEPRSIESEQPQAGRRFFRTRWEVLVVAVVVVVVLALVLPAIQYAREAARKAQCRNHLMQIGLAILNYTQTHRTFPPGTVCTMEAKCPGRTS